MARVRLETRNIVDWPSFHEVSARTFGFPDFYGRNLDAWIDCLTYLHSGDGMSRFHLATDEVLHVEVIDWPDFRTRLPEVADALVECAASVNHRLREQGGAPVLALETDPLHRPARVVDSDG